MALSSEEILAQLTEKGLFQTWRRHRREGWILASGLWSPFYLQLRRLPSHPELLAAVGEALGGSIRERLPETSRLIGLAMAGVPIATAAALAAGIPFGFTRKIEGVKTAEDLARLTAAYGGHRLVEAELAEGDRIVLVDDLLTSFASKEVAIAQVQVEAQRQGVSLAIDGLAVLVVRGSQGVAKARAANLDVVSLVELTPERAAAMGGAIGEREAEVIANYLRDPLPFQQPAMQAALAAEALGSGT
jgi:orotate phosphoribosyltransferase